MCPSCAAQVPTVVWESVAGLIAAPFAIVAVVATVVIRAIRREARLRELEPTHPASVTPVVARPQNGPWLA